MRRMQPVSSVNKNKTRLRAYDTVVSPVFFNMCKLYLCNGSAECMKHMVVPEIEQQVLVIKAMHQIAMQTDINGMQSTFLTLLLDKNVQGVSELLQHVVEYNHQRDAISNIVDDLQSLHMVLNGKIVDI